jgi:5-methyltetrahydrofolate--homocysteine methyltransferase
MTRTVVESKTKTAIIGFDEPFCVIGERINPTGRKILNAELEAGDYSRVEADAIAQTACGCHDLGHQLWGRLLKQNGRRSALCG